MKSSVSTNFTLLSAVLFYLISCNSSDHPQNRIDKTAATKTIVAPPLPKHEVRFQDFVSKIEIVPLETTDRSLFRTVTDFVFLNRKFYVYDMTVQELFVFDEQGKFLYRLDKRGKGPGEYLEMRDFEVDENGNIYILSYKKILVYDSLTRLTNTIPLSLPANINPIMFALAFEGGYYLYSGSFAIRSQTPNRYSIYAVDSTGTFNGDAFFPVINNGPESPRFFNVVGEKSYTLTPILGNDTVYKLTPKKVIPQYYLDYGSRKLPPELYTGFSIGEGLSEASKRTDLITGTYSVIETESILGYSYKAERNICVVFHSKETGTSFSVLATGEFGTSGFFPRIRTGVGRTFYGHIDSHLLINSKNNGVFKQKFGFLQNYDSLEGTINGLKENDNVAIMAISFNNF